MFHEGHDSPVTAVLEEIERRQHHGALKGRSRNKVGSGSRTDPSDLGDPNAHANAEPMKEQKPGTIDCTLKIAFYPIHSTCFDSAKIYTYSYRETFRFPTLEKAVTREKQLQRVEFRDH